MTKFRNRKVELDGFKFDSVKESVTYSSYKIMQKAGLISDLQVHPIFHVLGKTGKKICKVILDFSYFDVADNCYKYIDVKGLDKKTNKYRITNISSLKKKLVEDQFGIKVEYV